jgi:two-component system sensor histidine kinase YesM
MFRQEYLKMGMPFDPERYLQYPYETSSQMYWLNLHPNEWGPQQGPPVASLYKWIEGPLGERTGLILLQLKESFFRDLLSTPKISPNGYLLLASPDQVVSFKDTQLPYSLDNELLRQELMKQSAASGKIRLESKGGKQMTVLYDTISINKWKLAAVYPQDEIYENINNIKYVTLSVMLAVLLIGVMLSGLLANIIARPVTRLTRQVDRIEQGHLEVVLPDPPSNEIGILSKGIQDMLGRIKQLLAQVEHEQEQKRLSELAVLQAQIQPHFLYNTLFSIKQLCEMNETQEASQMITALSNYFRISISKGSEIIPVASELEHVNQYLIIQQKRYGKAISYEINVPAEMEDCQIVKLTLQPLVENAIYHGVKKVRRSGMIEIHGWMEGETCYVQVKDNGYGISPERLEALEHSLNSSKDRTDEEQAPVGYGVRNVHRRLQLHYGVEYGLTFHSEEGRGTTVTVVFPARRMPESS